MKKNMGNIDRGLRIAVAAIISILYFTNTISGTLGITLLVVGGVFLMTSFLSFCPIYTLLGVNTCRVKK